MKKLLILPGWMHTKELWLQQAAQYLQKIEVQCIDFPGFVGTPPPSTWSIPEYANWLDSELTTYKFQPNYILAHSFGGRVAVELLSNYTKYTSVSKLLLYASPNLYRPSVKVKAIKTIAPYIPSTIKSLLTLNPELAQADSIGMGSIYRKVVSYDQSNQLSRIDIPCQILWGDQDKETPIQIAKEMEQLLPQAKLQILPKLGHLAHLENPDLFWGSVRKFL